jgi:phosphopantothenoylcysteine decarboxylase/phosphopantothenate--cysteine ligase
MNVAMYNSPAVKRNLEILRGFEDTTVLESPAGELACGEVGQGRLMEPAGIVKWLEGASLPLAAAACASSATPSCGGVPRNAPAPACPVAKDIDPTQDATLPGFGKKVLLTAGRTEEAIDPVRYISNRSSGKTAVALASVFYANGFIVEVVAGPMEAAFPGGVKVTRVKSARDMHDAVMERLQEADAVVHCAAVADYRPAHAADSKIKDSRSQLVLELVPNPNILRDCTAARASRNQNAGASRTGESGLSHPLNRKNWRNLPKKGVFRVCKHQKSFFIRWAQSGVASCRGRRPSRQRTSSSGPCRCGVSLPDSLRIPRASS